MARAPNMTVTPIQILTAVSTIMVPNTTLQQEGGTVAINTYQPLLTAATRWPAVVLITGARSSARIDFRTWQMRFTTLVTYYDRWDDNGVQSIDDLWQSIDQDLDAMQANLEDNPTLTIGSVRNALSISEIVQSAYTAEIDKFSLPFSVIKRTMNVMINVPAYLSVR
jgi:hypothetical protein